MLRWVIGVAFVAPRRGDLLLGKGMPVPEWASLGALACAGCALSACCAVLRVGGWAGLPSWLGTAQRNDL